MNNQNTATGFDALTPQQFAAALREHIKDIKPAQPTTQTVLTRLAPHRATLMALRREGYTTKQIAGFLRDPKFGINVGESSLRRLLQRAPRRPSVSATSTVVKYRAAPIPGEAS